MKLVQCPQGHYYDADKYEKCPLCFPVKPKAPTQPKPFVNQYEPKQANTQPVDNDATQRLDRGYVAYDPANNVAYNPANDVAYEPADSDATTPLSKATDYSTNDEVKEEPVVEDVQEEAEDQENTFVFADDEEAEKVEVVEEEPEAIEEVEEEVHVEPVVAEEEKEPEQEESLRDTIKNISETLDNEDVTIAYPGYQTAGNARGYVVGWLVCTKGAAKGLSYPLYAGKNFIGRGANSDICIKGDQSIARDRHAVVIYDPRSKSFIAIAGESKQLYYINDQLVLSQIMMQPRDVLSLGETDLLFIPLVGDQFDWDNYNE